VSPEQVRGEPATPASDWYSFGCVLHELLAGTPPFTGPTVDVVMRQHLDAPPPPITRTDVPPELGDLVAHLLAKDPADRPTSSAQVTELLTASSRTQVLAFTPPAAAEVLGVGKWEEEPEEPAETGTHRAPGRTFPLAKVGIAAAVVVAGVVGALLLRAGVTNDAPAQAGGTPSAPVVKASSAPKTTPKPTQTPSKKPTPKPTPKETPHQNPQAVLVSTLRTLAAQVRATQQGSQSKAPREAARDLDQAAEALDHGDTEAAAEHFYDARQRLIEAQQRHRWQATAQIAALFSVVSRSLPRPDHNNE
jgi:serine/threonine-protein kinase